MFQTITELELMSIMRRFRVMTRGQIDRLFKRANKSDAKIHNALMNLYTSGYLYYDKENDLYLVSRGEQVDIPYLCLIWVMLGNTRGTEDELMIYRSALVDQEMHSVEYFKNGKLYYIFYIPNEAGLMMLKSIEKDILERGINNEKETVRVILASELRPVLEKADITLPYISVLIKRNGFGEPELQITGKANA